MLIWIVMVIVLEKLKKIVVGFALVVTVSMKLILILIVMEIVLEKLEKIIVVSVQVVKLV